jgi:hypothetical protein
VTSSGASARPETQVTTGPRGKPSRRVGSRTAAGTVDKKQVPPADRVAPRPPRRSSKLAMSGPRTPAAKAGARPFPSPTRSSREVQLPRRALRGAVPHGVWLDRPLPVVEALLAGLAEASGIYVGQSIPAAAAASERGALTLGAVLEPAPLRGHSPSIVVGGSAGSRERVEVRAAGERDGTWVWLESAAEQLPVASDSGPAVRLLAVIEALAHPEASRVERHVVTTRRRVNPGEPRR